jgi:hypothetical protein
MCIFCHNVGNFFGGRGVYLQCKHVYHVLQSIMFYGLMKEFIHHYTCNWDEVQRLLKRFKALNSSDSTSQSHS